MEALCYAATETSFSHKVKHSVGAVGEMASLEHLRRSAGQFPTPLSVISSLASSGACTQVAFTHQTHIHTHTLK